MDVSKKIVMQSHLSDALLELKTGMKEQAILRIHLVKCLLNWPEDRVEEDTLDELLTQTMEQLKYFINHPNPQKQ